MRGVINMDEKIRFIQNGGGKILEREAFHSVCVKYGIVIDDDQYTLQSTFEKYQPAINDLMDQIKMHFQYYDSISKFVDECIITANTVYANRIRKEIYNEIDAIKKHINDDIDIIVSNIIHRIVMEYLIREADKILMAINQLNKTEESQCDNQKENNNHDCSNPNELNFKGD